LKKRNKALNSITLQRRRKKMAKKKAAKKKTAKKKTAKKKK
jgi:hypothetical protein